MDGPTLIELVTAAFNDVPRPDTNLITSHRCVECDEVRDDLADCTNDAISEELLKYHGSALPLLTAAALRYYLPAYLVYSINNLASAVTEYLVFHLSPSKPTEPYYMERRKIFTNREKAAICAYLSFLEQQNECNSLLTGIQDAKRIWCTD